MEKSIPDILDSILNPDTHTKTRNVVSIEAVRELTLEKIGFSGDLFREASKPRHKTRLVPALLCIIAILSLCTVALAATGVIDLGSWFDSFFEERSGGNLSTGQQEFIQNAAVGIGQSVTSDGLTVTVDSVLNDEYTAYIKLNVEAPEGTNLDEGYYYFQEIAFYLSEPESDSSDSPFSAGGSFTRLDDGDGRSNTASFLIERSRAVRAGSDFSYADGKKRMLILTNFCEMTDDYTEHVLNEGKWNFEFNLAEEGGGSIQFIDTPVECQGRRGVGVYEKVNLTSFILSSFGASLTYTWDDGGVPEALEFEAEIVMKDGSTVPLQASGASGGNFSFRLNVPIVLDDIDYIRVGETILTSAE